jgi:uracil-DNA glycosylase
MIDELRSEIEQHPDNLIFRQQGYKPLFSAAPTAKIVIIGQAPGKKAQLSGKVWDDASGERLIRWLGISEEVFRDPTVISHMPMDFYYPGKGISGDLPPRKDFAGQWHAKILQHMPSVELMILIGQYAQKYYLGNHRHDSLTDMVRSYRDYLPEYFPLVHPSPLNFRWMTNNPWFEAEVIPDLQLRLRHILTSQP